MKKLILLCFVALLIVACGEKKESEEKTAVNDTKAGKIEIVENKDYKEIKVKDSNTTQMKLGAKSDAYYFNYNNLEEKTYSPLDATMRVRSPYEHIEISLLVSRLSKNFIVKCSACHNDYANGIIGPSLLSKDRDYIYNAIIDFKTGKKVNPLMTDLVKMMNDKEISELSNEIALFNTKIKQLRKK